jgi:hypothetical protein
MLWLLASTLVPDYFPIYFPGANDPACEQIKLDILYGVGVLTVMFAIQIISILKLIKNWNFCSKRINVDSEYSGRRISGWYFVVAPGLWLLYAMWHVFNAEQVCKESWAAISYTNLLLMCFIATPSVLAIVALIFIGLAFIGFSIYDRFENPEGGVVLNFGPMATQEEIRARQEAYDLVKQRVENKNRDAIFPDDQEVR